MIIEKKKELSVCGECFAKNSITKATYPTWRFMFGAEPFERKITLCKKCMKKLQKKIDKELKNEC